ncbi:putative C2 domain-containing protein [Helianthus annuus]|uniref:C2 domain-containing protein n=1 Tax=Helianthus annuus TaxID=4232 RepID=A0A251V7P0_HELAN|nr:putative C2 domain-containing protein [Helianthus annuus]KAJ0592743.1 putative C2 domain-containing protein [Helianthus annuus]KAJ0607741.1 putative C2 domain-containing protein [Helianthus annuus]KAJ0767805.1 putative C2 domain-containing protein [Helianthus annuus]KAJ0773593.1 putative C2 domain-containing protein [Helianthus annuus]
MANHGGKLLEVTVVGCNKLKDTTWFSRQDPYVCVEYGSTRNRTRVCTDGGKNPTFQEKFVYNIFEGLKELNVIVWNSNIISRDDFIGGARVNLAKILSQGYDDSSWPLQTKNGSSRRGDRTYLNKVYDWFEERLETDGILGSFLGANTFMQGKQTLTRLLQRRWLEFARHPKRTCHLFVRHTIKLYKIL